MATRLIKQQSQPIHALFKFLQSKTRVEVWLYEQVHTRLEGVILGFDEYMNLVLDGAEEVDSRAKAKGGAVKRKALGRILLKGDNITAVAALPVAAAAGT